MDALPDFRLLTPGSVAEALEQRRAHPASRMLGGGTDLTVNIRRGIGDAPDALIEVRGIREMQGIELDGDGFRIGAAVTLAEIASHPELGERHAVLVEAAASIAGPTHRHMGTVGGNLCLDTRCIFYNQSEWWRCANEYCLKYGGERCHVAPGSKRCYATFSGDLAPALLLLDAEVEVAGPQGSRTLPLGELYTGDGEDYLALTPGELVVAVRGRGSPERQTGYEKFRIRRSIEYPVAGVAAALARERDALTHLQVAFTGTNPAPLLLDGTRALTGAPLDDEALGHLEALCRKQVMAMKTTFVSGHYRRSVATVLAKRLVSRLYEAA